MGRKREQKGERASKSMQQRRERKSEEEKTKKRKTYPDIRQVPHEAQRGVRADEARSAGDEDHGGLVVPGGDGVGEVAHIEFLFSRLL